jgi:hypothetical protein
MTVTDDDRHAPGYKTRANLTAEIPPAISISSMGAANTGWRAHRTKKHHPACLSGVICCARRQRGFSSVTAEKRQRIAIKGEVPRAAGWHGYCCP